MEFTSFVFSVRWVIFFFSMVVSIYRSLPRLIVTVILPDRTGCFLHFL